MTELFYESSYMGIVITLAAFLLGSFLKKKLKSAVFNPVLIAVALLIAFLVLTKTEYQAYNAGARYISLFLTPATVCLAVPLYEQFSVLKKNWLAVLAGILSGVLASLTSVFLFTLLFRFSHTEYATLLPKSITTAIGMGVSEELGGIPSLSAALIILTGITGNLLAEPVLKLLRIHDPAAQGVAIGSSSHAIGTSKALEIGDTQGAMSSLSIVVAGILTVLLAPLFVTFL